VNELKRVSLVAIIFLVLLRMSIGWQFLYEGLWKYDTLDTAQPWTSEGYLKNAQGPFRDHFRNMTGDPDDLNWLDYEYMGGKDGKWDRWRDRFIAHYGLNEGQVAKLNELLDGKPRHAVPLEEVPESAREAMSKYVNAKEGPKYDPATKQFTAPGNAPLLPSEAAVLLSTVPVVKVPGGYSKPFDSDDPLPKIVAPDPVDLKFYQAIEKLQQESAKLGYRQRLAALLRGNPDNVGVLAVLKDGRSYETVMANAVDEEKAREAIVLRYGEVQVYKDLLAEYERMQRQADIDYEVDHLTRIARKIQAQRATVVGPVKALEAELKKEALRELDLKPEQVGRGALPPDKQSQLWQVDQATIWGLVILGSLLILGFCSRLAALGGAVMLVMFYLPVPPWPGVPYPQEMLGPEHSYIINKNLIEAIALLGIAALPTGSWFGVDGLIRWMFRSGKPKT
jgi:uncharacterized membrane protein YphA (DoxX/SURF4 family)